MNEPMFPKLGKIGLMPDGTQGYISTEITLYPGLLRSPDDPPDMAIILTIDAVVQRSVRNRTELLHMPELIAEKHGKEAITFEEYKNELIKQGFNFSDLVAEGFSSYREFHEEEAKANQRAAEFFHSWMKKKYIDPNDFKRLIDSSSIVHFLELVLANADTTIARLKAEKLHEEHRAMKVDVFNWLDEKFEDFRSTGKSMDDIAQEQIAGKLVPLKFRTVREWMTEWKKLRSAGRP
jgi:hypothetical protein